jgi:hypothetical protein
MVNRKKKAKTNRSPRPEKVKRKDYDKELARLHAELVRNP